MHYQWYTWALIFLVATAPQCSSALPSGNSIFGAFVTGYTLFVAGGRILHDVAASMGLLTKVIKAYDYLVDNSAQEQLRASIQDSAKPVEPNVSSPPEVKPELPVPVQEKPTAPTQATPPIQPTPQTPSSIPPPQPTPTQFDGCGKLGLQVLDTSLPRSKLSACCTTHDLCYASACKAKKSLCDKDFKKCMSEVCEDLTLEWQIQKNCLGAAKLLYSGTMALSTHQYKDAQNSISCGKEVKKSKGGQ